MRAWKTHVGRVFVVNLESSSILGSSFQTRRQIPFVRVGCCGTLETSSTVERVFGHVELGFDNGIVFCKTSRVVRL